MFVVFRKSDNVYSQSGLAAVEIIENSSLQLPGILGTKMYTPKKLTPTLLKYSFVHSLSKYSLGAYYRPEILLGPKNTVAEEMDHCLNGFTLSFGGRS